MEMAEANGRKNQAYQVSEDENDFKQVGMEYREAPIRAAETEPDSLLTKLQDSLNSCLSKNGPVLLTLFKILLLLLFLAYFGYAMYYEFGDEGSIRLLVCTVLGIALLSLSLCRRAVMCEPLQCLGRDGGQGSGRTKCRRILYWCVCLAMAAFVVVYTVVDVALNSPRNLVSLSGIAFFILVLFLTSSNSAKVQWHPVFWGMSLQYVFALIILRTEWGYQAFQYLGDRVTELLAYSTDGASFVFGDDNMTVFAFSVLSVIVYFSSLVSVLYYLGVMQALIKVVGRFLALCLNTSATESINTAANIFMGHTDSPMMIRPFLPDMTNSELHAVLTGGFATVSGAVIAAYIKLGVKASYLVGASVMSAPAALAMSKLACPETEERKTDQEKVFKMATSEFHNLIEAATEGASRSIKLCSNVAVNLIAFLALLGFLNATLVWFGDRVGVEGLTFQFLCSYIFYPITFLMGVDETDCRRVAQLIGYKTFANEFIAYVEMGKMIDNFQVYRNYTQIFGNNTTLRHNGMDIILPEWNRTLTNGFLTARSEVIATYALCGFSNVGSMGMMLGALGGMAPSRKSDLARLVVRALVAGSVACFMTACTAGLFFQERS